MVKRSSGSLAHPVRTKGAKSKAKAVKEGRDAVDPKLMEKYTATRQREKKRQLFSQIKDQLKNAKRKRRVAVKRQEQDLGEKAPKRQVPKTIERLRKPDATFIEDDEDEEILRDEADDEFEGFYTSGQNPKVLITTSSKPHYRTKQLVKELLWLFPNSVYRPRRDYHIKEIIDICKRRDITDLVVVTERIKQPWGMIISHLPDGPTATYRLSNIVIHKELEEAAERTEHYPELNFKNFDTRLGRRLSRMLQAMFPAKRDYEGRAIATFHNQRDYVFLRVHRYVFDSDTEVRIQEMGPRITFRLLSLQLGTFDTKYGEYEWFRKKEMNQDKLQWYL